VKTLCPLPSIAMAKPLMLPPGLSWRAELASEELPASLPQIEYPELPSS